MLFWLPRGRSRSLLSNDSSLDVFSESNCWWSRYINLTVEVVKGDGEFGRDKPGGVFGVKIHKWIIFAAEHSLEAIYIPPRNPWHKVFLMVYTNWYKITLVSSSGLFTRSASISHYIIDYYGWIVQVHEGPPSPVESHRLLRSNRPCVFRNAAKDVPALKKWTSNEYLVDKVGHRTKVTTAVTTNGWDSSYLWWLDLIFEDWQTLSRL